tara:strand:+ start:347 stop:589 length:243 start_codon:yes stop_codon:yes gene_type:complete
MELKVLSLSEGQSEAVNAVCPGVDWYCQSVDIPYTTATNQSSVNAESHRDQGFFFSEIENGLPACCRGGARLLLKFIVAS